MDEDVYRPGAPVIIATVAGSLLALVTISGNLLVITAFIRGKRLQSIANGFLVSLACADLVVGVVVVPFRICIFFYKFRVLFFSGPLCYVYLTVEISTCTSSILHLCIISVDRYIAIVHPMTYPVRMSRKTSLVIIGTLWCLSVGASISLVIFQHVVSESTTNCLEYDNSFVNVFPFLAMFVIPATVMGILYAKMFLAARAHIRRVQRGRMTLSGDAGQDALRIHRGGVGGEGPGPRTSKVSNPKYKTAKTIGIVIGALLVCWLPFNIIIVIGPWCPETCRQWYHLVWLGFVNSTINPFIYAFTNSSFKMAFMKILHCERNTHGRRSDGGRGSLHIDGTLEMSSASFPCAYPLQHRYF